jgi:sporulation protein YlmC with PRC-barrel domain
MDASTINVALRILDDQLVDADGRRFGRIDDIELAGGPGRETRIAALIVGAGSWRWRLRPRLAAVMAALTPNIVRRIPWELVGAIEAGAIRTTTSMGELGFGTATHVNARWVDELERQTLRLSSLLGVSAVSAHGEALGRVHDVRARLEGAPESPHTVWITGILVGRDGWGQRLMGPARNRHGHPSPDAGVIRWSDVERIERDTLVLSI